MYVIDAQMHLLILPSLHIAPYYASNQYEYIYIYRERERERWVQVTFGVTLQTLHLF